MFIGTTGKKTLVMNVVRVVTGVKEEGCREDTLYTFLFDMCRKQTKGAPRSRIKDKSYDFAVELDKKGLSKRVCQIFAAQVGVEAVSEGSLVQRIGHYLTENNLRSIPLRWASQIAFWQGPNNYSDNETLIYLTNLSSVPVYLISLFSDFRLFNTSKMVQQVMILIDLKFICFLTSRLT